MKPGRFILNSDFCTNRKNSLGEISAQIPDPYTTPASQPGYKLLLGEVTVGDSTDNVYVWFTSSRYNYATFGPLTSIAPAGATGLNGVSAFVTKKKNKYSLYLQFGNQMQAQTYRGYGMTLTAHIQTYKDPFSE